MPTKRTRRVPHLNRFTPDVISALAHGVIGIELGEALHIGRHERFATVCPPLAEMALAMPREQLERFLGFKVRDQHVGALERWAGEHWRTPTSERGPWPTKPSS